MRISFAKLFIHIFFLISANLFAQQNSLNLEYYFSSDQLLNLDPKIPTPQSVLGFNVGEWHVSHDKLVSRTCMHFLEHQTEFLLKIEERLMKIET